MVCRVGEPGPFGGPVGRVDQRGAAGGLHELAGRVVAQIGGEEDVHPGGAGRPEEGVSGSAADRDPLDGTAGVPGDPQAARRGGEPAGGLPGELGEGDGGGQRADAAQATPGVVGGGAEGTSGPVRPTARASASETPGSATSALVWAVKSPMSFLISVWIRRPLKVVAATLVVPRR